MASAGIISTGSFGRALFPGVSSWWGKAYDEYPEEYVKLFDVETSSRAYELDVGISSFGAANIKQEGQAIAFQDESQSYTTKYTHVAFALGFIITREMFDDDLYDVVGKRRAEGLAFSMRQTKENYCANVYNRAFNSDYVGGDGVSIINSAHPNFAGGTASNTLETPTDFSEFALEQSIIQIKKFTNDAGLRISAMPQTLHIPVELEFEARRILNSTYRVGSDNNDINALKEMGAFPGGVHVNHYFTNPGSWFIRTNVPNGMKFFSRTPAEFSMDNDVDTDNAKFKAFERYSAGNTDWRAIFGSEGTI